jgi:hypothetical protein
LPIQLFLQHALILFGPLASLVVILGESYLSLVAEMLELLGAEICLLDFPLERRSALSEVEDPVKI